MHAHTYTHKSMKAPTHICTQIHTYMYIHIHIFIYTLLQKRAVTRGVGISNMRKSIIKPPYNHTL